MFFLLLYDSKLSKAGQYNIIYINGFTYMKAKWRISIKKIFFINDVNIF